MTNTDNDDSWENKKLSSQQSQKNSQLPLELDKRNSNNFVMSSELSQIWKSPSVQLGPQNYLLKRFFDDFAH